MAVSNSDTNPASPVHSRTYKRIAIYVLGNAVLVALWVSGSAPQLAAEDGILETLQLLFAAAAIGVFAFVALEDDGPIGTSAAALAGLVAVALLREIDVRQMVVPDWMMIWADSVYRDAMLVGILILVALYALRHRAHIGTWVRLSLKWHAWPLWLSGACFATSVVVERTGLFGKPIGLIVEEMTEFNGFVLLLVAAWSHCRLLRAADRQD